MQQGCGGCGESCLHVRCLWIALPISRVTNWLPFRPLFAHPLPPLVPLSAQRDACRDMDGRDCVGNRVRVEISSNARKGGGGGGRGGGYGGGGGG